jgi:8-oxo-dGTP diphosphatase
MMTRYVCGFYFNEDKSEVALIYKLRPEWQKGNYNGIGGKIEGTESNYQAMVREFEEETGLTMGNFTWKNFCIISGTDWLVNFFYCFGEKQSFREFAEGEEKVVWIRVIDVLLDKVPMISNLKWLILMCLDPQHRFGTLHSK